MEENTVLLKLGKHKLGQHWAYSGNFDTNGTFQGMSLLDVSNTDMSKSSMVVGW